MPTALSLFSGAGGLDLGIKAAGWTILGQLDADPDCAATLTARRTRTGPLVVNARLEDVPPHELMERLDLAPGGLDLLAGGPPCQPFTTHGKRRAIADTRAMSAFPAYLDYVRAFRPAALLIENVDGFLSAALRHRPLNHRGSHHAPLEWEERKGSVLHWILSELGDLGYAVTWGVVEAADYGVPQFRQRAVLIGTRDGDPCFLPPPTHGPDRPLPFRTLRDEISGLTDPGPIQPLSEAKRRVYSQVPAGGNWRSLSERVRRETMGRAFDATGGKSGWWRRLAWDQPAPTILGMPDHSSTGLIHPEELRCLGLHECAALQTFPLGTYFGGRPRSQYQQVGDAVPPVLAKALAKRVKQHLMGARLPVPDAPAWRRSSANRRIGTHGFVVPSGRSLDFQLVVKVREDHVWATARAGVATTLRG